MVQSLSNSGKPHDNAVAEAFFFSMKREWIYSGDYRSEAELRKGVTDYIQFYNARRPHASMNYTTPDKYEKMHIDRGKSRTKPGQ